MDYDKNPADNEGKSGVLAFRVEVGNRLRELEKRFENREAAARAAGVAKSTLQSWIEGKSDPSFIGLVRLSRAANCDLNWIATGEPPRDQRSQSPLTDSGRLDLEKLEAATSLIEEWLDVHRRTMRPKKKAEVIAAAYEILIERTESTSDDSVRNNVIRLLRVAS